MAITEKKHNMCKEPTLTVSGLVFHTLCIWLLHAGYHLLIVILTDAEPVLPYKCSEMITICGLLLVHSLFEDQHRSFIWDWHLGSCYFFKWFKMHRISLHNVNEQHDSFSRNFASIYVTANTFIHDCTCRYTVWWRIDSVWIQVTQAVL